MNYYDEIAKSYNELHKEEQLKKLRIIKKYLKPKIKDKLLDIGCGTGISTKWKCKSYGIDPSIELLKLAKNKAFYIQAEAENLPFKNKSFDIIISVTAMQNFKDLKNSIKEMKRVGKKTFILTFLKKSNKKDKILKLIKNNFKINNILEEDKDIILFLS